MEKRDNFFTINGEYLKTLVLIVAILFLVSPVFAASTGWLTASTKRQIESAGSSSPFTLTWGRSPTREVQALFKWDIDSVIPEFAEVTGVEYRFDMNNPTYAGEMSEINRVWDSSSTWFSLGNGLSGSEIGPMIKFVLPQGGGGIKTEFSNAPFLIPSIQKDIDGVKSWQGIIFHSPINNVGVTNGIFNYQIRIAYNPRVGGDADLDGDVDFTDFLALSANYETGSGKVWAQGDFTGDGEVKFNDYLILAGNFGYPNN